MNRSKINNMILRHEGYEARLYIDSVGIPSIGIGFNINYLNFEKYGIDRNNPFMDFDMALTIMNDKVDNIILNLQILPWFIELPEQIQEVLVNMCYNLGMSKLLDFKRTIGYLKIGDWKNAAKEMLNSKWADQVGSRATELSNIVSSCEE